MDTVPYMEKGFVFPVYNILLLPGVSTMIYYSQEPSGLKEALRILKDVKDIAQVRFNERDVVRHKLVQDIIKAYEKIEEGRR